MTATLILYVLLPIIGTVMLFMVMDKRMKAGAIIRMFWNAFKGVPPVREEDRVARTLTDQDQIQERIARILADQWAILDQYHRYYKDFEFEKVDWKKEGF